MHDLQTRIVKEAHRWIGTPFCHQGRLRGVGCDCAGLVAGVLRNAGISVRDEGAYPREGSPGMLLAKLREHAAEVPIGALAPGDIIVFRIKGRPVHAGIFVGDGVIHAYFTVGRVVKHELTPKWQKRIYKAFRIRQ